MTKTSFTSATRRAADRAKAGVGILEFEAVELFRGEIEGLQQMTSIYTPGSQKSALAKDAFELARADFSYTAQTAVPEATTERRERAGSNSHQA